MKNLILTNTEKNYLENFLKARPFECQISKVRRSIQRKADQWSQYITSFVDELDMITLAGFSPERKGGIKSDLLTALIFYALERYYVRNSVAEAKDFSHLLYEEVDLWASKLSKKERRLKDRLSTWYNIWKYKEIWDWMTHKGRVNKATIIQVRALNRAKDRYPKNVTAKYLLPKIQEDFEELKEKYERDCTVSRSIPLVTKKMFSSPVSPLNISRSLILLERMGMLRRVRKGVYRYSAEFERKLRRKLEEETKTQKKVRKMKPLKKWVS
jgi:hypothetical protein